MGKISQKCMLRLTLRQQSYKIKSATDCAILERKNVAEAVSRRYLKNIENRGKKSKFMAVSYTHLTLPTKLEV